MKKNKKGQGRVVIEDDMTVYSAPQQKNLLLDAVACNKELDLDLSGVGDMDSAGFQLLLLAKREAVSAGRTLRISAHSKAVTELLDLYNMASYFGDPLVMPAKEQFQAAKKGE